MGLQLLFNIATIREVCRMVKHETVSVSPAEDVTQPANTNQDHQQTRFLVLMILLSAASIICNVPVHVSELILSSNKVKFKSIYIHLVPMY